MHKKYLKNSTSFHDKTFNKLGIEGMYLNMLMTTAQSYYYNQWQKKNYKLSSKVKKKTSMFILIISIQHSSGSLNYNN